LHPLNRDKERRLLVMDIASKKTKELSEKGVQPQEPLHWKSDSGSLLYAGLKDYKFFYDEAKRTKVYQGGMHIYISTTEGKTVQLTKGDHLYSKPTYSPDEKNIAFLYADELGGAREVILKTMNADGSNIQERANSIVPTSTLIWR
jgi:TolB protein